MATRETHDEESLTKKHFDLVHDYLELQRLRVEVLNVEIQIFKQKSDRQLTDRREPNQL